MTTIVIKCQDGVEFSVKKEIMTHLSGFIANILEDEADNSDDGKIIIPNFSSNSVKKIIEFCIYHYKKPAICIPQPLVGKTLNGFIDEFYQKLVSYHTDENGGMTYSELIDLIKAVNFMDVKEMAKLVAAKTSTLLKTIPEKEIGTMFTKDNEYSEEEKEELRKKIARTKEFDEKYKKDY